MLRRKVSDCANENEKESKKHSPKWGNNMQNGARLPPTLAYTWHSRKNAKFYNRSAVLSSWRLLLCWAYSMLTVHSSQSSPLPNNITHAYPMDPFAQYLGEVLYVVSPHVICVFCETSKIKKQYGWKGSKLWPRKKLDPKLWNVVDESSQKNAWSLDA